MAPPVEDDEPGMAATSPSCGACWATIEAGDDVVWASNPVNAPDRTTGEIRVFERGEFAYFHARCWREDDAAGWVARARGPYGELAAHST